MAIRALTRSPRPACDLLSRGGVHRFAWLIMMVAAAGLAVAGCGGPRWPSVRGIASKELGHDVVTIDMLPIDIAVTARPGYPQQGPVLEQQVAVAVGHDLLRVLGARGYEVVAPISWQGRYVAGDGRWHQVMPAAAVASTVASLSTYGRAQASLSERGRLLVPFLPSRLGQKTGSDATLYVGGRAYVGVDEEPDGTGEKVVKGIVIAAAVVVIAAAIIIGLKESGSDAASAVGNAAASAASAAGRAALSAGSAIARVGFRVTRAMTIHADAVAHALYAGVDAFGHTHTHLAIHVASRPPPPVPEADAPSSVLIEMTLVDNRTGRTLWHARQKFGANLARADHRHEVLRRMLGTLPARTRAQPR